MRKYRLARPEAHNFDRWDYTLQRDGSVCLRGFRGNRDVLHIPERLLGRPVTALGDGFFSGAYVQLVTIPPTVTCIGPRAFAFDDDLQAVLIPDSVVEIDDTAFRDKQEVILFVGEGSFAHGYALSHGMPCEVDTIPELEETEHENFVRGDWHGSFVDDGTVILREYNGKERVVEAPSEIDGCPVVMLSHNCISCNEFVEEIIVPDSVTSVGSAAFAQCSSLRRIRLPDSLTWLGMGVFAHCRDLEEIRIPKGAKMIQVMQFLNCASLRRVLLPEGVRLIAPMAFSGCRRLEEIRLPDTLETVCETAFDDCPRLRRPELPPALDARSLGVLMGLRAG